MDTMTAIAAGRTARRLALSALALATTLAFAAGSVGAAPLGAPDCPVKWIKAPTPAEYQAACGKPMPPGGIPLDPGIGNGQPPLPPPPPPPGKPIDPGIGNGQPPKPPTKPIDPGKGNGGVQNTGSNNGTNTGATGTAGTGNNTATGNQVQGNGNTIVGGGNTTQANNATNVNGSGNTVTNVTGVGNTVNSGNKTVTNVTQVQNTTQIVEAPSQPQVVYVQEPAQPAPAPEVTTVIVSTDLGLSIDRGAGAEYAAGDPLGIGYSVSRPMRVEIAFVRPEGRTVLYTGTAEGPGEMITVVPAVPGVMLLEMSGVAEDGSTTSEMVWFLVK